MNKKRQILRAATLCLCLILSMCFPVQADEEQVSEQKQTLKITTTEEFLIFAENCRLDSYSENLVVLLETDVDLTDTGFAGIPIFSGTMQGGNHRITGLMITGEGSNRGLFRYLTQTATVKDLVVYGEVSPGGSRSFVGGLAGSNAGTIENCTFSGAVSGSGSVGGLVGINGVTGVIGNCTVTGNVQADHFAGGIAGENYGVIRHSVNEAQVNTTAQQNNVEISDITMDTLTNAEAANTVTDIGGISGVNGGVIRDSENKGNVGYRQMGYNVGGIAGSNTGYITGCSNYAQISGRKEVGGIAGQMEPVTQINFTEDALQQLREQMNDLSALTNRAAANAQGGAAELTGQLDDLEEQIDSAANALEQLIPGNGATLPDVDSILAAQNALSSAMHAMNGTMNEIAATTRGTATTLSKDMQAVAGQMNEMGQTLQGASEYLGASITDVSDMDTETDITGKISGCANYGAVLADLNAGGIAGAMSLENDLDPEDDLQISGDSSLNFETLLRAVVRNCENHAVITARKQCAGGIVGWQALGLVRDCTNSGRVDGQEADYVGGIVGRSSGYIRTSSVKCEIDGRVHVGGIAGSGNIVSDCRSMVRISGREKLGAILGAVQDAGAEKTDVANNVYLPIGNDMGGIDGISYSGQAQPLAREAFLAQEGLADLFNSVTVSFVYEDGSMKTVLLKPGDTLKISEIPDVPEKAGYVGEWAGLEEAELTDVSFDMVFTVRYTANTTTIQSTQLREDGRAVLLAQGEFLAGQTLTIQALNVLPQPLPEKTGEQIDGWSLQQPTGQKVTQLRYCLPNGYEESQVQMLVYSPANGWRMAETSVNGRYLVFPVDGDVQAICLVEKTGSIPAVLFAGVSVIAVAAALILGSVAARRKKAKQIEKKEKQ